MLRRFLCWTAPTKLSKLVLWQLGHRKRQGPEPLRVLEPRRSTKTCWEKKSRRVEPWMVWEKSRATCEPQRDDSGTKDECQPSFSSPRLCRTRLEGGRLSPLIDKYVVIFARRLGRDGGNEGGGESRRGRRERRLRGGERVSSLRVSFDWNGR